MNQWANTLSALDPAIGSKLANKQFLVFEGVAESMLHESVRTTLLSSVAHLENRDEVFERLMAKLASTYRIVLVREISSPTPSWVAESDDGLFKVQARFSALWSYSITNRVTSEIFEITGPDLNHVSALTVKTCVLQGFEPFGRLVHSFPAAANPAPSSLMLTRDLSERAVKAFHEVYNTRYCDDFINRITKAVEAANAVHIAEKEAEA